MRQGQLLITSITLAGVLLLGCETELEIPEVLEQVAAGEFDGGPAPADYLEDDHESDDHDIEDTSESDASPVEPDIAPPPEDVAPPSDTVGSAACPAGTRLDCYNQACLPDTWLGDGFCDLGLNCPALDSDGGDCDCPQGQGHNCKGECWAASVFQDKDENGTCDSGLNCERFNFDQGQCDAAPCEGCLFDGICVPEDAPMPGNACMYCMATDSPEGEWIAEEAGEPCSTSDEEGNYRCRRDVNPSGEGVIAECIALGPCQGADVEVGLSGFLPEEGSIDGLCTSYSSSAFGDVRIALNAPNSPAERADFTAALNSFLACGIRAYPSLNVALYGAEPGAFVIVDSGIHETCEVYVPPMVTMRARFAPSLNPGSASHLMSPKALNDSKPPCSNLITLDAGSVLEGFYLKAHPDDPEMSYVDAGIPDAPSGCDDNDRIEVRFNFFDGGSHQASVHMGVLVNGCRSAVKNNTFVQFSQAPLAWQDEEGGAELTNGSAGIWYGEPAGHQGHDHQVLRNIFADLGVGVANPTDADNAPLVTKLSIEDNHFYNTQIASHPEGALDENNLVFETWQQSADSGFPPNFYDLFVAPEPGSPLETAVSSDLHSYGALQSVCSWSSAQPASSDPGDIEGEDLACYLQIGTSECAPIEEETLGAPLNADYPWCIANEGVEGSVDAVQAAIDNAASLGGGTVFVAAGEYNICDSNEKALTLGENVTLRAIQGPDGEPTRFNCKDTMSEAIMRPLVEMENGSALIGVVVECSDEDSCINRPALVGGTGAIGDTGLELDIISSFLDGGGHVEYGVVAMASEISVHQTTVSRVETGLQLEKNPQGVTKIEIEGCLLAGNTETPAVLPSLSEAVNMKLEYNHICGPCDPDDLICYSANAASTSSFASSCEPCVEQLIEQFDSTEIDNCSSVVEKGAPYDCNEAGCSEEAPQSYVGYHQGSAGCTYNDLDAGEEEDDTEENDEVGELQPCPLGQVRSCDNLSCASVQKLDDGTCDDSFDCARYNFDASDCSPPDEAPEGVCGSDFLEAVQNCDGQCAPVAKLKDNTCAPGLNCLALNYDAGQCSSEPAPDCSGKVQDLECCELDGATSCASCGWIATCDDSVCVINDAALGLELNNNGCQPALNCEQFWFDGGDCTNNTCASGQVPNCMGQCSDAGFLFNGACDASFDCETYDNDNGACGGDPSGDDECSSAALNTVGSIPQSCCSGGNCASCELSDNANPGAFKMACPGHGDRCYPEAMIGDGQCDPQLNCDSTSTANNKESEDCGEGEPTPGTPCNEPGSLIAKMINCWGVCEPGPSAANAMCDVSFACEAFNYDNGDCVADACTGEQIPTCTQDAAYNGPLSNTCMNASFLGNETCNALFNCEAFGNDHGDCEVEGPLDPPFQEICLPGHVKNCYGWCQNEALKTNDDCDPGFACADHGFDSGQCPPCSSDDLILTCPLLDDIFTCVESELYHDATECDELFDCPDYGYHRTLCN